MAGIVAPKIITNGLVLCLDATNNKSYPGNGDNWSDLSGYVNNGTLIDSPSYALNNNGSLVFDGVSQYADLGSEINSYLTISLPFTLEVFCYLIPTGIDQAIISNTWDNPGIHLRVTSGNAIRFIGAQNGGNYCGWDSQVITEGWYHVVGTHNGLGFSTSNINIYKNGINDNNGSIVGGSVGTIDSPYNLNLARSSGVYNAYMGGRISAVKIYNRELSPSEIQQNFNVLKGRYGL